METQYLNPFLNYLSDHKIADGARLPSLSNLSNLTDTSIPTLREQLEVARALGFVEVRPKTGIRKNPYQFTSAVTASLSYAIACNSDIFPAYADLRKHIEASYFEEAASLLEDYDIQRMADIIHNAKNKLTKEPAEIPFQEHRSLHLLMYSRLNNIFVTGILEAYWNVYEEIGLTRYTDLDYHNRVWIYHQKIVETIKAGEYSNSKKALLEHMVLLQQRPTYSLSINHFE